MRETLRQLRLDGRVGRVALLTVGRVTRVEADQVDVTLVGVGVVRYSRGELSPRRVGQVLFAQRRADHWDALRRSRKR